MKRPLLMFSYRGHPQNVTFQYRNNWSTEGATGAVTILVVMSFSPKKPSWPATSSGSTTVPINVHTHTHEQLYTLLWVYPWLPANWRTTPPCAYSLEKEHVLQGFIHPRWDAKDDKMLPWQQCVGRSRPTWAYMLAHNEIAPLSGPFPLELKKCSSSVLYGQKERAVSCHKKWKTDQQRSVLSAPSYGQHEGW